MGALRVEVLGRLPYGEALALQEEAVAERRAGARPDTLFLLEHPPVVTLGRGARPGSLLASPDELARRGVALFEVGRGGDATYHAPGQLVGYPILDLEARGERDLHAYLRRLEAVLRDAAGALGVPTRTVAGRTGVFAADDGGAARKLASIGVGARGWVTRHGFALNVDLDLDGFDVIVPCGLRDVEMTSLARELGPRAQPDLGARAREAVVAAFRKHFA